MDNTYKVTGGDAGRSNSLAFKNVIELHLSLIVDFKYFFARDTPFTSLDINIVFTLLVRKHVSVKVQDMVVYKQLFNCITFRLLSLVKLFLI